MGVEGNDVVQMLVVHAVDMESAGRLAAWMMHEDISVDMCCAVGPFISHDESEERGDADVVAREGDVTSILALLENIVCRVCYIPAHTDPISLRSPPSLQPRLTPNAINLHGRQEQLCPGLIVAGISEPAASAEEQSLPMEGQPGLRTVQGLSYGSGLLALHYRPGSPPPHSAPSAREDEDVGSGIKVGVASTGAQAGGEEDIQQTFEAYREGFRLEKQCQQHVLVHICASDAAGIEPVSLDLGGVVMLRPGKLKDGHFSLVRLDRSANARGWTVGAIAKHMLPT